MMVDITCIRGEGHRPGDDIVEPLLSTVEAALHRGRIELDQGELADEQTLDIVLLDRRLGETLQIEDSMIGTSNGKIVGLSHTVSVDAEGNISGTTTLNVRKLRAST